MNRARPDDNEETVVFSAEDLFRLLTGRGHQSSSLFRHGKVIGKNGRGDQGINTINAEVVGVSLGHVRKMRSLCELFKSGGLSDQNISIRSYHG